MLLVAIHGDQPVVVVRDRETKGADQALPVPAIVDVPDHPDSGLGREELRRFVRGPVINDQNLICVLTDLT